MARPLPLPEPETPSAGGAESSYPWFVGSVVCWFSSWGMQHVLFSWLVVGELRAPADRVGVAMTCLMLPSVAGLLVGGAVADRQDRRRILMGIYAGTAVLVAVMSLVIGVGLLSFPVLVVYALAFGSAQAFVLPARDALISDVAGTDLMRAVIGITLAQFAAQAVGTLIGGSARWIGTANAVAIQGAIILVGLIPLYRMRITEHRPVGPRAGAIADIRDGLREVMQSDRLRTLTLLVMGNGIFFVGPFFVVLPLMVRDVYDQGVGVLSLLMMMFPAGMIIGSAFLLLRGGIRRKGLGLVTALFAGAVCLTGLAAAPPLPVFLGLVLAWGLCGSVFLNSSRTLFQAAAPPSHRARVLSVYSLGIMGMAPIGNFVSGLVADRIGGPTTCAVFGVSMMALVGLVTIRTRVTEMR
jgi:MFS family permease